MYLRRLSRGRSLQLFGWLALTVALLPLMGCGSEEVTSYRAPKAEPLASLAETKRVRARLLVVVVPQGKQWWVFKLLSPEKQAAAVLDDFDAFIDSVELSNKEGKPIQWKLPANWKEEPGDNFRYATLAIETKDAPLQVSVTRMDDQAKLGNINRWRGQVGLDPVSENDLPTVVKNVTINGVEGFRLDMVGTPKQAARPMMPPAAKPVADKKSNGPKYKTPEGWKDAGQDPTGLRYAGFTVAQDDKKAIVTIVPLPGDSGSMLANVNRWRQQMKLKEIDEEQLKKDVKAEKVGGAEGQYVKIVGETDAILGVIVKRGAQTWFFKMTGPKDLVNKQETVFQDFCRSVEF